MLMVNKNSRFISLFAAVLILLSGITFIQLTSSAPAQAAEGNCASTGACQDISTSIALQNAGSGGGGGSLTRPPSGGGGPVSGGGGGVSAPPAVPTICDPRNSAKCAPQYIIQSTFFPNSPNCGPKMVNGIKVNAVGNTMVAKKTLIGFGNVSAANGANYTGWTVLAYVCNYPPDPVITGTNIKCILSYNANISRLSNSYAGAANISSRSQSVATLGGLQDNPSGCRTSMTANFGVSVGRSQADYGWYKATSNITWANCKFGYTTFNGVQTRTGGCQNAGTLSGSVGKLTVYCGPAIHDWVQLDWTGKDCYPFGPKCTVPNNSKFNGFTGNVQALRDGNDNNMTWANPVFTAGISGAGNWRTKTDINSRSTPYKLGTGPNDSANQLFRSNQSFGTWNSGSLATLQNQKLAFYTSGSSGLPFSMTRNYLFDANFTTTATTITGYNVTTGAMSTGSSSTTVYLRNNPCGPQSSPNINAVRAIGDVLTR